MFPDAWSRERVVRNVRSAAETAIRAARLTRPVGKPRWHFTEVVDGVTIEGYLTRSMKTILTAFPVP